MSSSQIKKSTCKKFNMYSEFSKIMILFKVMQFAFLRRNIFEWDQFKSKNLSYKKFHLIQKCDQLKENDLDLIIHWGRDKAAQILIALVHKNADVHLNPFLKMTIKTLHKDPFGNFIGKSFSYIHLQSFSSCKKHFSTN